MKIRIWAFVAVVALGSSAAAVRWVDPAETWVSALQRWLLEAPVEKVYVFTDKPLYAPGETVWYRAWLINGLTHTMNSPSGVLFVELLGPDNAAVVLQRVRVDSSAAYGDIALPDSLGSGTYTLRAYTTWMRNAGEGYFFSRSLTVTSARPASRESEFSFRRLQGGDEVSVRVNIPKDAWGRAPRGRLTWTLLNGESKVDSGRPVLDHEGAAVVTTAIPDTMFLRNPRLLVEFDKHSEVLPVPVFRDQLELHMLPEGGDLVAGLRTRVAVVVRGMNGVPAKGEGRIVDAEGNVVVPFVSEADGIGLAEFTPEAEMSYRAEMERGGRLYRSAPEAATESGVAIRVDGTRQDAVPISVHAAPGIATPMVVLAHVRGQVHFAGRSTEGNADFRAELPRSRFPAGIVHLTVFDGEGNPRAERLLYTPPTDSVRMAIQADQSVYKKRERVQIRLQALDAQGVPVVGAFAVSVTGKAGIPDSLWNGMDIGRWMLLGSDLEGGFGNTPHLDLAAADRLLLTKGWRRFRWEELREELPEATHDVETGLAVSGRVVNDVSKRGASDIEVTAFSMGAEQSLTITTTDDDGHFFLPLSLKDSTTIVLQAKNKRGRKHYEFRLDPVSESEPLPPLISDPPDSSAKAYLDYWFAARERLLIDREYGLDPNYRLLGNVTVEAKREMDINDYFFRPTAGVDRVVTLDEIRFKDGNALEMLRTIHPKFNVNGEGNGFRGGVRLFLNGMEVDAQELSALPASWIDHIELVWDPSLLMTMSFLGASAAPAAFYYTKRDGDLGTPPKGIVNLKYPGYYAARDFFEPDYSQPDALHSKPDRRSTLAWRPFLRTAADGTVRFEFWTGDLPGDYRIRVEGLTKDGRTVVAEATVAVGE